MFHLRRLGSFLFIFDGEISHCLFASEKQLGLSLILEMTVIVMLRILSVSSHRWRRLRALHLMCHTVQIP